MTSGAANLRKIIKRLQKQTIPSFLSIIADGPSLLQIEKRTGESGFRTEFGFTIRIETVAGREVWWPIQYIGSNGEIIKSETELNGRTLVNLQRQNELVTLAETWARTLDAQHVASAVGNALL